MDSKIGCRCHTLTVHSGGVVEIERMGRSLAVGVSVGDRGKVTFDRQYLTCYT